MFVSRDKTEIPDSVKAMITPLVKSHLVSLDLCHNAFGPQGIRGFDFLLRQNANIKVLKVANCGLSPEGGVMIAEALIEGKVKLKHLEIGRNRQEDKGFVALGLAIGQMGSLQVFDGIQNGVREEGMVAIFNGLMKNGNLREIKVNDNYIQGEALNRLCKLIHKIGRKRSLRTLEIGDCEIDSSGMGKIVNYLSKGGAKESLETFGINYSAGDPANTWVLKKVLETLSTFKRLGKVNFVDNHVPKDM